MKNELEKLLKNIFIRGRDKKSQQWLPNNGGQVLFKYFT